MTHGERTFQAQVLDATVRLRVDELCARVHVERRWIAELVDLGALEPLGSPDDPAAWAFTLADVPRVRSMARLVEELGVNWTAAAIILDLVEERRQLLSRLRQWETSGG